MLRTIATRIASKAAVRGLCFAAGLSAAHEVPLIDLRGKLPTAGAYPVRDLSKVDTIIIHHTATQGQSIRSIAQMHVEQRGWQGIAYHFAVNWEGKVFYLNDIGTRTNHAQGINTRSIGVVFIGNHDRTPPTPEAVHAMYRTIAMLRAEQGITRVLFHGQTKATACPGRYAIIAIDTLNITADAPVP